MCVKLKIERRESKQLNDATILPYTILKKTNEQRKCLMLFNVDLFCCPKNNVNTGF